LTPANVFARVQGLDLILVIFQSCVFAWAVSLRPTIFPLRMTGETAAARLS
jgi:hypothetical protein